MTRSYTAHYWSTDDVRAEFHFTSEHRNGSKANRDDLVAQYTKSRGHSLARHLIHELNSNMVEITLDEVDNAPSIAAKFVTPRPDASILDADDSAAIDAFIQSLPGQLYLYHYDLRPLRSIKEKHSLSWNDLRSVVESYLASSF